MGSVSGALAGEAGNSMVVGGDFFWGDNTPAEEAENSDQTCYGLEYHKNILPDFFCLWAMPGISKTTDYGTNLAHDLFLYDLWGKNNFTFLNCHRKNKEYVVQYVPGPAKPEIFTLWPFNEKKNV